MGKAPNTGDPVRLLRIITRLNVGGPSYQAIYLSERLRAPDWECRLLVGNVGANEGSMEPLARERSVPFARVPGLGREISLRSDLATVAHLYREIRRFRPQIVHTHLAKAGMAGRLAAHLARVPVVIHTYHGHVFHGYFSPRTSRMIIGIERGLARLTDRLIVLGQAQEEEILGYGVGRPEQMVRVPLGLELEPFLKAEVYRGRLRSELAIDAETPLVGIVARLVPVKAHALFLEAAAKVAHALPETEFLIVGDGELRAELEQQAATRGLRKVRFLGFRRDLPAIYADLDAVVLSSINEGLPVTLIEALAAGRPVVATNVGSVRDLVVDGETGRIVSPGDASSLARAVVEQLQDREAANRMARAGRDHVYPRFSVERLVEDLSRLYLGELAARGVAG